MDQLGFSEVGFSEKKQKIRSERFLDQMDLLTLWKCLEKKIAGHYPETGNARKPCPLNTMIRVHWMQLLYNFSDPAVEDALYVIDSMSRFAGLSLSGSLPDETTILKFRHLLDQHKLGKEL